MPARARFANCNPDPGQIPAMDEIVNDFLIESGENLDRLDQELVKLESDPQSEELLASIFRTIHTIKGSCGFLGFGRLEKVTQAGESLLSRLRDGELALTAELISGLLAMVDAVRRMLAQIRASEHDGEDDYAELIETLKKLQGAAGKVAQEGSSVVAAGCSGGRRQPKEQAARRFPRTRHRRRLP